MLENNFPQIWVPGPENRGIYGNCCGTVIGWCRMRTRIHEYQLQALAMNEGYRWKKKTNSAHQDEHC